MCVCVCAVLLAVWPYQHAHAYARHDQTATFFILATIAHSYFCLGCHWQQQQQRRICLSKRSEKSNGDYDCIFEVSMLVDFFVYLLHSLTEKPL